MLQISAEMVISVTVAQIRPAPAQRRAPTPERPHVTWARDDGRLGEDAAAAGPSPAGLHQAPLSL
ncbi:hypothetical protein [Streptomyces sp. LMG1-1-1.1]|uniref:hypothetical protein n=1 Tax=Streptomyces sp. LMG1-1-1.1 TaxID=3135245 RepID=UPI0034674198